MCMGALQLCLHPSDDRHAIGLQLPVSAASSGRVMYNAAYDVKFIVPCMLLVAAAAPGYLYAYAAASG